MHASKRRLLAYIVNKLAAYRENLERGLTIIYNWYSRCKFLSTSQRETDGEKEFIY
jgi:hypothetical protein